MFGLLGVWRRILGGLRLCGGWGFRFGVYDLCLRVYGLGLMGFGL